MQLRVFVATAALVGHTTIGSSARAQQQPTSHMLKAVAFFSTAGVPGDDIPNIPG
jgi:hypothetical protein